jgi:hypothetical protein
MLPNIAQLQFDQPSEVISTTVHKTFAWDFVADDFKLRDGKLIVLTGLEYLKVWIQKAIRTIKDTLTYEGTEYGSGHDSLIGSNFNPAFAQSEYARMIRECLLQNDAITRVDNFTFSQSGARLTISFEVQSIYGTLREEVTA